VLKYVAYLSYADVAEQNNELIRPFTYLTNVNQDLSITIYIPTLELANKIIQRITELLKQGISGVEKHHSAWTVETCTNLREGIVKRWYVQSIDDNAFPMVFKDVSDNEILIYRSRLAIKYPSPFQFTPENLKKAEIELLGALRKYYSERKVCHDDLEPVLIEKISEMSLEELLRLIPVEENKITYCLSADTIRRLPTLTNPLTRQPLSEKSLTYLQYLESGWRGLFDIGPLFGLYSEVPTKVLIKPTIGIPDLVRIRTTAKEREIMGL